MTSRAYGSGLRAAFGIALLIVGLNAARLEHGYMWLDYLPYVQTDPLDAPLALLAVGMLMIRFRYGVATLVCMLAAAALGGVESYRRIVLDAGPIEVVPAVLCVAIAAGALLYRLPLPARLRSASSVAVTLSAISVGAVVLIAAALRSPAAPAAFPRTVRVLVSLVLGVAWIGYLFHGQRTRRNPAVSWLSVPAALAGLAGTAAIVWVLVGLDGVPIEQRMRWTAAAMIAALGVTALTVYGVRLGAAAAQLRRANRSLKRLLARQQRLMHARTADLQSSRERYRQLFEGVPAPVALTSPTGKVLAANPALLDLLGIESEESLKSRNFADFYADPGARDRLLGEWRESDADVHQGELEMLRVDEERRNVLYSLRTIRRPDREIEFIQGTMTDITELRRIEASQKRLESHLRLSQKLESVGRLAAGIAHEINTPMQYIGDNVYFLKQSFGAIRELLEEQRQILAASPARTAAELQGAFEDLESELEIEDTLDAMPGALERAQDGIRTVSHIVSAMKELAHPGQGSKVSTNVNDLVNTALAVTRNAYKTVAAVETTLGDIPNVLTYKNELCQVLINLIVNAAHAIEARRASDGVPGIIRIRTASRGSDVCIEVEDNGCGIPEAAVEKIFDPFFTTKGVGQGTGQGLAIARATIVDKHDGDIAVDSTPGSGTTFTITLPIDSTDTGKEECE